MACGSSYQHHIYSSPTLNQFPLLLITFSIFEGKQHYTSEWSNFVPFMQCLITAFTGFEILPSHIYPRVHTLNGSIQERVLCEKWILQKYIYQKLAHTFNVCMIVCIEIFLYICTFIDHTYKTRNRLKELRPTLILDMGKMKNHFCKRLMYSLVFLFACLWPSRYGTISIS